MTEEKKTSKAQLRAIKKWRKKNPKSARINSYKGTAKTFVRHYATKEVMQELIDIFENENENAKK